MDSRGALSCRAGKMTVFGPASLLQRLARTFGVLRATERLVHVSDMMCVCVCIQAGTCVSVCTCVSVRAW